MWLRTGCNLDFIIDIPTPFIPMLRPRSDAWQWIARATYAFKPGVPVVEFSGEYGNVCQRLIAPPGPFSIDTSADVMTPDTIDVISGYDQVACISDWIYRTRHYNLAFEYDYMSATEVNQRREGICRDFAHLGIALCRGLCIPACMVVGAKVNRQGIFTFGNNTLHHLLGVDRIEGRMLEELFHGDDLVLVRQQLESRFTSRASGQYQVEATRPDDGVRIALLCSAMPETNQWGDVIGSIALLRKPPFEEAAEDVIA